MSSLKPPWIEFPDIPWGSVGWRMGFGEQYWEKWIGWYRALPESERIAYRCRWPEADRWVGFYPFVERGVNPPWAEVHHRKIATPQALPGDEEDHITDYFRVAWLLRNHLKREVYPYRVHNEQKRSRADEERVEFYSEPTGAIWRLGFIKTGGLRLTRAQVGA